MIVKVLAWLRSRSRPKGETVDLIVLHGTAGASGKSSYEYLITTGNSYHYIIDRDGTILKCVPTSRTAFHAGLSIGPRGKKYGKSVNPYSVGIAFANMEEAKYEPITVPQITAVKQLIKVLRGEFPLKFVTRHLDVSPGRKSDPCRLTNAHLRDIARDCELSPFIYNS